jgi:hypothetical protein
MRIKKIKCNGKEGYCSNAIKGVFGSFGELAEKNGWAKNNNGWACPDCQELKSKKIKKADKEEIIIDNEKTEIK